MSTATIETTKGTIELELFDAATPGTVANFKKLINDGFYDGLAFHRYVPNFVIQGGCPNTRAGARGAPGTGGPGWKIACETKGDLQVHKPYVLSMAHAGPGTGGSQFFITLNQTPHLDGLHTVFGKVTAGTDVVDMIREGDRMTKVTCT
ncbi:MAG: peptidylprolyl isomerase [Planctomycetota bacterium]|nr:peptidylprolyl isomerase [Planctomycetota bacterium]